eukprot:6205686-Pleurochrysis_carterae.AAC.3
MRLEDTSKCVELTAGHVGPFGTGDACERAWNALDKQRREYVRLEALVWARTRAAGCGRKEGCRKGGSHKLGVGTRANEVGFAPLGNRGWHEETLIE